MRTKRTFPLRFAVLLFRSWCIAYIHRDYACILGNVPRQNLKVRFSGAGLDPSPKIKMNALARVEKAAQVSGTREYNASISASVDWTHNEPFQMQNEIRFDFYLVGPSNFLKKLGVSAYFDAQQLKSLNFLFKTPSPNHHRHSVKPIRCSLSGFKTLYV